MEGEYRSWTYAVLWAQGLEAMMGALDIALARRRGHRGEVLDRIIARHQALLISFQGHTLQHHLDARAAHSQLQARARGWTVRVPDTQDALEQAREVAQLLQLFISLGSVGEDEDPITIRTGVLLGDLRRALDYRGTGYLEQARDLADEFHQLFGGAPKTPPLMTSQTLPPIRRPLPEARRVGATSGPVTRTDKALAALVALLAGAVSGVLAWLAWGDLVASVGGGLGASVVVGACVWVWVTRG